MNTGTHWTQDEIDDDKDYQIEVLEKRVEELQKENEVLWNFYTAQCGGKKKCGHEFSCICAGDAVRALGGDSNE